MTLNPLNQAILIGVTCVVAAMLLVRLFRRNRLRMPKTPRRVPARRPATPVEQSPPTAVSPTSAAAVVVPEIVKPKTLPATSPNPAPNPVRMQPQLSRNEATSVSRSLPTIEADETPLVDGSDYAFGSLT